MNFSRIFKNNFKVFLEFTKINQKKFFHELFENNQKKSF